jgi:hypothetical protein
LQVNIIFFKHLIFIKLFYVFLSGLLDSCSGIGYDLIRIRTRLKAQKQNQPDDAGKEL